MNGTAALMTLRGFVANTLGEIVAVKGVNRPSGRCAPPGKLR